MPESPPAPTIIAVAPNGAYKTREDHAAIPLTPEQLAVDASACHQAGASMLHLHVRDANGAHSLDVGRYREAIAAIRERVGCDLLLQITTESAGRYRPAEQRACVRELMPQAVSLAVRELAPDPFEARLTGNLIRELIAAGSSPQLILYHPDELLRYRHWQRRGIVPLERLPLLLVLGRYRPEQGRPPHLEDFLALGLGEANWMVCAFGAQEYPAALSAARVGGHVRVGFENNLALRNGQPAQCNAQLVGQIRSAVQALGHPIATGEQCRAAMLPRQDGVDAQQWQAAPQAVVDVDLT